VTKKDFTTAMNDFVLKPLGLKNILPNDRRAIISNRTSFYLKNEKGEIVNTEFVDSSFKLAGAGFLSTAEDLAKFGAALTKEGFLKNKTLDDLFQPMSTASGEKTVFGLGFRIQKDADGREVIYQPGGGVGISGVLFIDRRNKISMAVLTNRTGTPIGDLGLLRSLSDSFIN
jgi:serine beta-lactamase-like protein LACTB, mitochondrial